ncbi:Eco57I restriction-modification methylase domain-containing protein [Flavobacterium sp. CS20]|uniref:Eco57I restriction-modification methylase domain-containing protein n=1 Tax=Flavobacterium sp. CS20 TaxID=2775246 RepID=UPI001B3A34C3|nr:Eco57I restriction-modification methylase domain-containing protein [Flavobacterium sp. CS20]QTY28164.1 Eco57I restriction-modification methylase domain-containing protein [Flavobacterium sp. CS20]
MGFDIIIGNPPYIKEYTNRTAFNGFREQSPYYQGKMDIWYGFACKGIDLLKENGVECFIAQNNWITSAGASIFRNKILQETKIKLFTDFWNYKVFKTAGIQTMVYLLKKEIPNSTYPLKYSLLKDDTIKEKELEHFLNFKNDTGVDEKYTLDFDSTLYYDSLITFNNPKIDNVLNSILENEIDYLTSDEIAQGIVYPQDKLNQKNANKLGDDFSVNDGIFQISERELNNLNLNNDEYQLIKPFYSTSELYKYYGDNKVSPRATTCYL